MCFVCDTHVSDALKPNQMTMSRFKYIRSDDPDVLLVFVVENPRMIDNSILNKVKKCTTVFYLAHPTMFFNAPCTGEFPTITRRRRSRIFYLIQPTPRQRHVLTTLCAKFNDLLCVVSAPTMFELPVTHFPIVVFIHHSKEELVNFLDEYIL